MRAIVSRKAQKCSHPVKGIRGIPAGVEHAVEPIGRIEPVETRFAEVDRVSPDIVRSE